MRRLSFSIGLCAPVALSCAGGGLSLISSFNPAEGGSMNSIGYDASADEVYVHFNHSAVIHVYAPDGTFIRTVPKPDPGGNDDDMEFVNQAIDINGTIVPANSLIVIENDGDPPRITAVHPVTGAIIAEQVFDGGLFGQWTGGGYSIARGTFFTADWSRDYIQEVDATDGTVLNEFVIRPPGSPYFVFFYSDVDVLNADGRLYLVSDSQEMIRGMTPEGEWAGDFFIEPLGVTGISGIAFDDTRGEVWLSSGNGNVYRLGGFPPSGCNTADIGIPIGLLDLNDVTVFVDAFLGGAPIADLAPPAGVLDLADVIAFSQAF
ncbi:MAG: hypothetical protein K8E66_02215, partial [Phycisphaerales bacterium]|nr:hypothetical protein [Phycisphaerales bacterium]